MRGNVEEIRVEQMAIRLLVEATRREVAMAVFEFDIPAGAKLPGAHGHEAYEDK
jgi:hypothetical protein